jgi:hypothetical protein
MNLHTTFRATLFALAITIGLPLAAAVPPPKPAPPQSPVETWPRAVSLSDAAVLIYQPQIGQWVDNRIDFRCALAIRPKGAAEETFGVIFASARTKVDKSTRTVILDDLQVTKSDFPRLADHGAAYAAELQTAFATRVHTISLDRLKLSPALSGAKPVPVAVQNAPPRVIVSTSPAILVPIDGPPALRPVQGSSLFARVINTRALILQRVAEKDFFIHVFDGWLMAPSLDGPWSQPFLPPAGMADVARRIAATGVVDMLDGGPRANPKPSLANGIPAIYTSEVPAELIVFNGAPDFVPIAGTGLQWATNTSSDILVDGANGPVYALLAGRWFRASALAGPWTFVPADALPRDFARIPATSLAGAVLPAVAGTPQAQEALNENAIAQTATIPLANGPTFKAAFDGAPQYAPIAGTSLSYVINASAPVIRVKPDAYFAVTAGIWFTASNIDGPWTIATSVPAEIYAIPPSSPVYYVTYVRIFDATPTVVHAGYTPGYLGTAVSSAGTVVFGTGYNYASWIGNAWFAAPATYGVAAAPVYNPYVGFTYGFAVGLATPAWSAPYWGGAYYHPGYWGGYPCCGSAAANVYRRWGGAANARVSAPAGINRGTGLATAANNPPPQLDPAGNVTRGYDHTLSALGQSPGNSARNSARPGPVTQDGASAGGTKRSAAPASAGGAATGAPGPWQTASLANDHYVDANGNVYRRSGAGWQQQTANGWGDAPPSESASADQESQARQNAIVAENSVGISNASRFSGNPSDGWSARDSGDGGYSRTGGAGGGIGSEYYNYWQGVQNNEGVLWGTGVSGGGNLYYGGIGWGARYPGP